MNVTIYPSQLTGSISIIASKSLSHRYLIAAALSKEISTLHNLMKSDDIDTTITALKTLGASINLPMVSGGFPVLKDALINAEASGSTLRFLIPIAMLQSEPVCFEGTNRLPKRSLEIYEKLFKEKKLSYERLSTNHLPVRIKGPLIPGNYTIRGDVSSQFITGLLFALPLLNETSTLTIEEPFESRQYVDLTIDVLNDFGIQIKRYANHYTILGNQEYKSVNTTIEGDYSQAAFFMVAGLINNHPLTIKNLKEDSLQGDRDIIKIVKKMKGRVVFENEVLTVYPSKTEGIEIDLKDIPDLGPILMILASVSKGKTTFKNIARLRLKESDRIQAMSYALTQFGVTHTINENTMVVHGKTSLTGNQTFNSFNDHRIIMALTIASLKTKGDITITNIEHIKKSYPTFFEEFEALGGIISIAKEEHV